MNDRFARANVDPSAGVSLAPRFEICPRCGIEKGRKSQARPGLCHDCRIQLRPDERLAWAA